MSSAILEPPVEPAKHERPIPHLDSPATPGSPQPGMDAREPVVAAAELPDRILGQWVGKDPGPTLVCVGSMHGNEPAGFLALRRVFEALEEHRPELCGEFLGLVGNRAALVQQQRFLGTDLNRRWTPEVLAASRAGELESSTVPEDRELDDLRRQIEAVEARARGPVYFVDFHTTSGDGPPFSTVSDTLSNRAFALHLKVPIVVGLEEEIEGTMTEFVADHSFVAIGFEGGQHLDPCSVDCVEAAIWVALTSIGLLNPEDLPEGALGADHLSRVSTGLPEVCEVRFRQPVEDGCAFNMEPGFESFQQISEGQLLAEDCNGVIHARENGRILMPLYQDQGEDGFFEIREFRPFWLKVSALLRRIHLEKVVHWLPGVQRHPQLPDGLIVNRRVARWFALEIFHLLGYRRHRSAGKKLVVSRRREDS